jgi:hypothetical protein
MPSYEKAGKRSQNGKVPYSKISAKIQKKEEAREGETKK